MVRLLILAAARVARDGSGGVHRGSGPEAGRVTCSDVIRGAGDVLERTKSQWAKTECRERGKEEKGLQDSS